jgi:tetratricopeptide (TPR) repeat protein
MYDLSISTYLQAMQNAKKYSFRFSKILYNLSQIYYSIRDYDNAVKYIEEYYQLNNNELYSTDFIDRWNRFQLIRSYIAIGQYEEALDILKKMIFITEKEKSSDKLNINYIDAVRDYADILTEIGFHKEALRQYKLIEDINYLKLGTAYLNSFNYDKAEEYFLKELDLYNNRDSILKLISSYVDIYSNLASLEYRRGNMDKAIHYLLLAIKKVE